MQFLLLLHIITQQLLTEKQHFYFFEISDVFNDVLLQSEQQQKKQIDLAQIVDLVDSKKKLTLISISENSNLV